MRVQQQQQKSVVRMCRPVARSEILQLRQTDQQRDRPSVASTVTVHEPPLFPVAGAGCGQDSLARFIARVTSLSLSSHLTTDPFAGMDQPVGDTDMSVTGVVVVVVIGFSCPVNHTGSPQDSQTWGRGLNIASILCKCDCQSQ